MRSFSCNLDDVAGVLPSGGEPADEASDFGSLRPGTRLGRYELLVPIARGGMARVWAARLHGQRGFQKLVAIKTILPHLAEEPEFERMFLDEARIASGVHHPNVCEIYELGEERGVLYLAMEWVNGDSLSRVLRPQKKSEALDARVAARIVADACAGVHAAHELTDEDGRMLDVVHRDLSPHNILLSADGVVKVCDFGVAKALGQLHEQTSAGQLKGKVSYMSPEQITGGAIDRRSDVFSLGCVLYEATTGMRPFRGEHDHQIMNAIMNSEVEPPTSIIRGYPAELERIVLRALAHQPILRYPTAERMRFALEEFLAKGHLVTESNVAQAVRVRIGEHVERRKERIKQAQAMAEQGGWDPAQAGRSREPHDHRSGVKPSSQLRAAPDPPPPPPSAGLAFTPRPSGPATAGAASVVAAPVAEVVESDATIHGHGLPASSPTIPQAPAARAAVGEGAPPSSPGEPPRPVAGRTYTLPLSGPGAVMSPFAAADRSSPVGVGPAQPAPGSDPSVSAGATSGAYARPPAPQDGSPQAGGHGEQGAGAGQYAVAAFVGLLIAVLIGGGAFYVWRARSAEASSSPAETASVTAEASSAPAASGFSPASLASAEIALVVEPSDTVLTVDGRELPDGKRAVARPPAGKVVTVVARAQGYEDTSVVVDASTSSPLEIKLKPLRRDAVADAGAQAAASSRPQPKRPKEKDPMALPDNPY
jgi:serine/threonine-protein kinase